MKGKMAGEERKKGKKKEGRRTKRMNLPSTLTVCAQMWKNYNTCETGMVKRGKTDAGREEH